MNQIVDLIQALIQNWSSIVASAMAVMAAIGGVLYAVDSLLKLVAPLTPWKWDDSLAGVIGKWTALKIFNKGK